MTATRNEIRFDPDPMDTAVIGISGDDLKHYKEQDYPFTGQIPGLIENESHNGCNLVVILKKEQQDLLNENSQCILKLGRMNPHAAVVKWKKPLGQDIYNIGLAFRE